MSDPRVKAWQKEAMEQIDRLNISGVSGPVRLEVTFWHKDKRPRDLDNELNSIQDLLKNMNIIEDDNCFILQDTHIRFGGVDKDLVGAKITLETIDGN